MPITSPKDIKAWVREQQPNLDAPEVYVREINSVEPDWGKAKLRIALVIPVEYSAAIANMGVSILYDILNTRMGPDVLCERIYLPEPKLLRRMTKDNIPLFSKETFHQAREFDVLGFSSYYHLQCFSVPRMLEMAGLNAWSKNRLQDDPLVLFGGVAAFNPEPVADFVDAAFIGEGEEAIHDIVRILLDEKASRPHDTNALRLLRLQKEVKGIYVPRFYDFDYYPADDPKHPNQVRGFRANVDAVPLTHYKATADLDKVPPLTQMFVSNSEGQEMSAGSIMIATGCGNRCLAPDTLVFTDRGVIPIKDVRVGDQIASGRLKTRVKVVQQTGVKQLHLLTTKHGYSIRLTADHEVLTLRNGVLAKRRADELGDDDYLLVGRQSTFTDKGSEELLDLAALLGFFIGDGCIARRCRGDTSKTFGIQKLIFLTVSNAPEVEADILQRMHRLDLSPTDPRLIHKTTGDRYDSTDVYEICLNWQDDVARLVPLGFNKPSCLEASIPEWIFRSASDVRSIFLRYLFEADGTAGRIPPCRVVSFTTISSILAKQIQVLLASLDIPATISRVQRDPPEHPSYHVDIVSTPGIRRFSELVGFVSERKSHVLLSRISSWTSERDYVPGIAGYIRSLEVPQLERPLQLLSDRSSTMGYRLLYLAHGRDEKLDYILGSHAFFTQFESLTKDIESPVWDLEVDDNDHDFVANGLIVSNCRFCEGSFRTSPYRERDLGVLKQAFEDLIQNTGVPAVTPYSFNLSDFYKVNELVKWLLEDEDRKVSMSSQRIDFFSEDFARTAHLSGNRSITLAIESGSQRMRNIINKNISEEQILAAFETAFKIGFARIKIYMIANLPFETDDDNKAFADLMEKVAALRKKYNAKTVIRASWTPFQAKGATPFQWAPGLPVGANGLPEFRKTLTSTIERLKALDIKVRIGTDSKLSAIAQCISFGDRRVSQVIYNMLKGDTFSYRGGMSVGNRDPIEAFQAELKKIGLSYTYFFREKDADEVFPWDHIDIGIKKEYLLGEWRKAARAETTPPCKVKCSKCGICTDPNFQHFKPKEGQDLTNIASEIAATYSRKQIRKRLRMRIHVFPEYRYVHNSKIKMQLRRAAFRAGVPIRNDILLASDKLKFQSWTFGIDYAEASLHTADFNIDLTTLPEKMNKELFSCRVELISTTDPRQGANIRDKFDDVLYSLLIPTNVSPRSTIDNRIKELLSSAHYPVKMKVKGAARGEWVIEEIDARPLVRDIWTTDKGSSTLTQALLEPNIGVYELFPTLLKTKKRSILALPVCRVEYLQKASSGDFDMFASQCEVCGGDIELDVFGEPISSNRCARHLNGTRG